MMAPRSLQNPDLSNQFLLRVPGSCSLQLKGCFLLPSWSWLAFSREGTAAHKQHLGLLPKAADRLMLTNVISHETVGPLWDTLGKSTQFDPSITLEFGISQESKANN